MNKSFRYDKVKVVNEKTRLPTAQLIAKNLRMRNDIIKDKSFLRCHIEHWDRFTKLCDEQLATDLLHFVSMLILEVVEEVGTSESLLISQPLLPTYARIYNGVSRLMHWSKTPFIIVS